MEQFLIILPILLFSIVIHECAHGLAAEWCGDLTARMLGRITLNPLPHIDPIGSLLVPLLLALSPGNFFIAWAKPVPVNPNNFRNPRRDDIIVSVAGPASNMILALGFALLMLLTLWIIPHVGVNQSFASNLFKMLSYGILINLFLAFFNLLPVPPLDGSHILRNLLPPEAARAYDKIQPYGFIILLVMIYFRLTKIIVLPAMLIYNFILIVLRALT
jgi:Zn-dependent protease